MNAGVAFNVLGVWVRSEFDQRLDVLNKVAHRCEVERSSSLVVHKVNVDFVNSTEQENCRDTVIPLGRTMVDRLLA